MIEVKARTYWHLVLTAICSLGILAESRETLALNKATIDSSIVNTLEQKCNESIPLLAWPDAFTHPTYNISCQTLYLLQLPHNNLNRLLFNQATTPLDYHPTTISANLDTYGLYPKYESLDHLTTGHPLIFSQALMSDRHFSIQTLTKLSEKYPAEVVALLSKQAFQNSDIAMAGVRWTCKNLDTISSDSLQAITHRIYALLTFLYPEKSDLAHWVVSLSPDDRQYLLSLFSLQKEESDLLPILKVLVWTGTQYRMEPTLFFDKNASVTLRGDEYVHYLSAMRQLEDLKSGLLPFHDIDSLFSLTKELREKLNELQRFDNNFPYAAKLVGSGYLLLPDDEASQVPKELAKERRLILIAKELQTRINTEARELSAAPILQLIDQFTSSPLAQLTLLGLLGQSIPATEYAAISEKLLRTIQTFCDSNSSDQCRRQWLAFDIDQARLDGTELCGTPKKDYRFLQKVIKNDLVPFDVIMRCPLDAFWENFKIDKSITGLLSKSHGIPGYGGARWLFSRSIHLPELSQIGIHYLQKTPIENRPITPFHTTFIYELSNQFWQFGKIFTSTIQLDTSPSADFTPQYGSYAELTDLHGLQGLSLHYRLRQAEELKALGYPQNGHYNYFYYIAKSYGISRESLRGFIDTKLETSGGIAAYEKMDNSAYYLSDAHMETISEQMISDDSELLKQGLFQALSLDYRDKVSLCKRLNRTTDLEALARSTEKIIDVFWGWGSYLNFEYGNLDSICRREILIKKLNDSKSIKEKQSVLNTAFSQFISISVIPRIEASQNIADLRYLDSMIIAADLSAMQGSPSGIALSLSVLKQIHINLTNSYIQQDSESLREAQSRLEAVLTNLAIALTNLTPADAPPEVQSRLRESLWALIAAAHNPIISNAFRDRLVNTDEALSITGTKIGFNLLKEEVLTRQQLLGHSKTIYEYVTGITNPLKIVRSINVNPMHSANLLNSQPKQNFTYVEMISNGDALYFFGHDKDFKFFSHLAQGNEIQSLARDLSSGNDLISIDSAELCNQLSDVHEKLAPIIEQSKYIIVSPSVNVQPIPTEIILGTECLAHKAQVPRPIVTVNDYAAARDFVHNYNTAPQPKYFVGLGNPLSTKGTISFDPMAWRSASNLLDLAHLPPLPDAEIEVVSASNNFQNTSIFVGPDASIREALSIAETKARESRGETGVIVLATHGFTANAEKPDALPALLSVEKNELNPFHSSEVANYHLQNSIAVLSACDTAGGLLSSPDKAFTGFVKSFADAGSRLVVSSLWPVNSLASRKMTEGFTKELSTNGSITDAINAGRALVDKRDYRLPFIFIYP